MPRHGHTITHPPIDAGVTLWTYSVTFSGRDIAPATFSDQRESVARAKMAHYVESHWDTPINFLPRVGGEPPPFVVTITRSVRVLPGA